MTVKVYVPTSVCRVYQEWGECSALFPPLCFRSLGYDLWLQYRFLWQLDVIYFSGYSNAVVAFVLKQVRHVIKTVVAKRKKNHISSHTEDGSPQLPPCHLLRGSIFEANLLQVSLSWCYVWLQVAWWYGCSLQRDKLFQVLPLQ